MNPFAPGWRLFPPVLVGRESLIHQYAAALEPAASNHAYRRTHLVGLRSSSETVMLDVIGDAAAEQGWLTVRVEAGTDADRLSTRIIISQLRKLHNRLEQPRKQTSAFNVAAFGLGIGAGWQIPEDLRWMGFAQASKH